MSPPGSKGCGRDESKSRLGVNLRRANPRRQGGGASYITAVAQPVAEMLETEPVVEAARRVPAKHLKIDPLPVALDSDSGKPGHQPASDPLSARRVGDKQIFKIHPGSAEPSREPGVEQGKTGGLAVEKSEQRLELPLGFVRRKLKPMSDFSQADRSHRGRRASRPAPPSPRRSGMRGSLSPGPGGSPPRDRTEPPQSSQNCFVASLAPSAMAASLAHTTSGSTAAWPTQVPKPQSLPAMTLSRPTRLA
jgi:hypothetical protein